MSCGPAPEEVALKACELGPGLAMDPVGATELAPLLTSEEAGVLSKEVPTLGLEKVGDAGAAQIREASSCEVLSTERAGKGRWAVKLKRMQPLVKRDGTIGQLVEVELDWQVTKTSDGLRVEVGLPTAANARRSAADAESMGDMKRAASIWKSLGKKLGDPLVAVDLGRVQPIVDVGQVSKQIMLVFDRIEHPEKGAPAGAPNRAHAKAINASKRDVAEAEVKFIFTVDGVEEIVSAQAGPIGKGDKVEVIADIPARAEGQVKLDIGAVALQL